MHSDGALLDAEEVEFENLLGEDDEDILSEASSQDDSGESMELSGTAGDDDVILPRQSAEEPEYEEVEDHLSELSSGEHDDFGITSNSLGSSIRRPPSMFGNEKCEPDVRTSAVTGAGLQELLELIDEKLKAQDERTKPERIVERGVFDRKWRPPRDNDVGVAVDQ